MTKIQNILAASITLGAILVSSQAGAVSLGVKLACAADYRANCSMHSPDSPGVRKCMRSVGRNLSQGCLSALVGAGEVSKSVIEKRLAAK